MAPGKEDGESSRDPAAEKADAGADETLLTEMLAMTVRQRLQENDRAIRTIAKLRAGFAGREPPGHGGT